MSKLRVERISRDDWSGVRKYGTCADSVTPGIGHDGLPKTNLTSEEERKIEDALGYTTGTLKKASPFWTTFHIRIEAEGMNLNIDDTGEFQDTAYDYLCWKIMSNNPMVLKNDSPQERGSKPKAELILIDKEKELAAYSDELETTGKAYALFGGLSVEEKRKILILYGLHYPDADVKTLNKHLGDKIKSNPILFIEKASTKNMNRDVDVELGIKRKLIVRSGKGAATLYSFGNDTVGKNKEQVLSFFSKPENQEIYLALKSALKMTD
jgi:hypothetical protein